MQRVGLLLTLCLAGLCPAAGRKDTTTGNARAIPEVRSLYALRKLPPAHGLKGWVLRLGVADSGPEGGPWKLLLCHATYTGSDKVSPALHATASRLAGTEDIGPLSFTLESDPHTGRAVQAIKRAFAQQAYNDSERLYVAPIPTAWKGEYFVNVWSEKHELIQECRFTVRAPRRCPWMPSAQSRQAKTQEDLKSTPFLVPRQVWPAYPRFARETPIWRVPRTRKIKMAPPAGRGPGFLPGRLPPGAAWEPRYYGNRPMALAEGEVRYPLKLALRKDTLVVQSEIDILTWADEHLLGRWWVNGKPVFPLPRDHEQLRQISRLLSQSKQICVVLRLGAWLGSLKAGDKVSVQALYCPAGTVRIHPTRAAALEKLLKAPFLAGGTATQPMLSNKITFDVTRALLTQRKADGVAPGK